MPNNDKTSVSPPVRKGKEKISPTKPVSKVVELNPAPIAENIRQRGVTALEHKLAIERFLDEAEMVRRWLKNPKMRFFVELPDDEFDEQVEAMRGIAVEQTNILRRSMRQWTELTSKRKPGGLLANFLKPSPGGAE